jgi:hypothetical protein
MMALPTACFTIYLTFFFVQTGELKPVSSGCVDIVDMLPATGAYTNADDVCVLVHIGTGF